MSPQIPHDPSALADEIARTAAHLAAGTHRLLACIRAFDASEGWGHQGMVSCAHWLTWRIGLGPGVAREKVRVARALGTLPHIDDALRRGALSYSQVRALTRVATPANEEDLVMMARSCTAAQLERLCRRIQRAVAMTEQGDRPDEHRAVDDETLENGMVRLTVILHADEAALVMKAIEHARRPVVPTPSARAEEGPAEAPPPPSGVPAETSAATLPLADVPPETSAATLPLADVSAETSAAPLPAADAPAKTMSPRRSPLSNVAAETRPRLIPRPDALVAVAESYLAHHDTAAGGAPRTQIVLHVDQDPLAPDGALAATLDDGTRVSAETFRRLSCDATVLPVHHTPSAPQLDLGRRTRTISPALRRALALRDRGCAFPACPNTRFLHAHHLQHWAHGGPTTLSNLVHVCTRHHRLLHEGGFHAERGEDGPVVFTDPRGTVIAATPTAYPLDDTHPIADWTGHAGSEIDAQTSFPDWDGEPIDYMWAVDALVRDRLSPADIA